jgi:hypothetical protein
MTVYTNHRPFGVAIKGLEAGGSIVKAGVFNEHQVLAPRWVPAKPQRLAWHPGLVTSSDMVITANLYR